MSPICDSLIANETSRSKQQAAHDQNNVQPNQQIAILSQEEPVSPFKVALIDKEREDIPDFVFEELADAGIEFVYGICRGPGGSGGHGRRR